MTIFYISVLMKTCIYFTDNYLVYIYQHTYIWASNSCLYLYLLLGRNLDGFSKNGKNDFASMTQAINISWKRSKSIIKIR